MATGIEADFVLILAGVVIAGMFIWRDRTSSGQVVFVLILVAVALAQTIWGDARRMKEKEYETATH